MQILVDATVPGQAVGAEHASSVAKMINITASRSVLFNGDPANARENRKLLQETLPDPEQDSCTAPVFFALTAASPQ